MLVLNILTVEETCEVLGAGENTSYNLQTVTQ